MKIFAFVHPSINPSPTMKVTASPTNSDGTVAANINSTAGSTPAKAPAAAAATSTGDEGQTKEESKATTMSFTLSSVKTDAIEDKAVTGTLVLGVKKEGEGFTFTSALTNLNHGEDVHPVKPTIVDLNKDDAAAKEPKWAIEMNLAWDAEANKFVTDGAEPVTACAANLLKSLQDGGKEPARLEFFTKAAMAAAEGDAAKKPFLILSCEKADEKDAVKGE